jgi:peptide/nickel transport system permease protein
MPADERERYGTGHRTGHSSSRQDMTGAVLAAVSVLIMVVMMMSLLSASQHETGTPPSKACTLVLPPTADAGEDLIAYVDGITTFDGSSSHDDLNDTVGYEWTFEEDGVPQTLEGVVANYTFSIPGIYDVTLNVTDGEGFWHTDVVTVTVELDVVPPFSHAGYNYSVPVGVEHELNGSRSVDNETGITNYTWTFVHRGAEVMLHGESVWFTFEEEGVYEITLTVVDGAGLSSNDTVSITVTSVPTWLSKHSYGVTIGGAVIGITALYMAFRWRRNQGRFFTDTERDKMRLRMKNFRKTWKLFRANRLGFSGFIILCIFMFMAIFAPWLSTVQDPNLLESRDSEQDDWENPTSPSFDRSPYTGFIHPLGTDNIGQDVYSLTLYGTRASLMVGFAATFISIVLGVAIGLASGYFGRFTDEVLMRFTDYFLVLPWFPLMIVLMTVLGAKFEYVILVIGLTSWPSTARIVRSQVLTVKERAFIERARAIGAGDFHIVTKHVVPNVMPLVFANTVLLISLAIFSEAFIDFFGLGDPDVISWGMMLEAAYGFGAFDSNAWWWILPPSAAIILCILAFSMVGYALDDILNPKLRKR